MKTLLSEIIPTHRTAKSVPILTVSQLSVERDGQIVFAPLSFHLSSGQILNIVGENGAGKTTLLRLLSGLMRVNSGRCEWLQDDLKNRASLLWLGHRNGLKMNLSADENLRWLSGIGDSKTNTTIEEALTVWNLIKHKDKPIRYLSCGQQRRVSLARLTLLTRKTWILDEPFASLDSIGCEILHKQIENQLQQNGSVILSSHTPLSFSNTGEVKV